MADSIRDLQKEIDKLKKELEREKKKNSVETHRKTDSESSSSDTGKKASEKGRQTYKTEVGKISIPQKADKNYKLIDEIKKTPFFRRQNRNAPARKFLNENLSEENPNKIVPGQLVMFRYFEPKNMDDLEYYDAEPCTIFFGVFNAKEGKRVLGFNIHYYPPKIRYRVMNKIFEIYKPIYSKYFTDGTNREIDAFDYKYLMEMLAKYDLDFGVRMYIPSLIKGTTPIPPNMWQIAVFTEGNFKKRTRTQIMNFWRLWHTKHSNM